MRILVAGFGNPLRGDDGFGVEVIRRLRERDVEHPNELELMDVGIGGIHLAQELVSGYSRLIIVDAMTRGGPAGTVYTRRVESVRTATEIDLHLALPSRVLSLAMTLGVLPSEVFLVGCEPGSVDELTMALSPPVEGAVEEAIARVRALIELPPAHQRSGELEPAVERREHHEA